VLAQLVATVSLQQVALVVLVRTFLHFLDKHLRQQELVAVVAVLEHLLVVLAVLVAAATVVEAATQAVSAHL
jgi:hypothetical protein